MKQVLFMAMLAAGLMLAGCSKEEVEENNSMEEKSMEFTIDTLSISLLANEDYKITPSGGFVAKSTDENVATVSSDGVIHGVSAGEADIIFTSVENSALSQTCKVSVDWRYKYYDEPVIAFGATKEEIKARETHSPSFEDDNPIIYDNTDTEIEMETRYYFGDGGELSMIHVIVWSQIRYKDYPDKIATQLAERYGDPFVTEKSNEETVFEPRGKNFSVHFYPHILLIEYLPKN